MSDLRTLTGRERQARRSQYAAWWEETVASKEEGGAISTTHDIDAVILLLGNAIDALDVIEDVIKLGNDLLAEAADSPMSGVARAFNDEISRALMGKRS